MKKKPWIYDTDPYLRPFKEAIDARHKRILDAAEKITGHGVEGLDSCVNNHLYYGLHKCSDGSWVIREWAPNASRIYLIGESNNWRRTSAYEFKPAGKDNWELKLG